MHAEQRRPGRQRPVDLAIADAEPRESAEQPAAQPFDKRPAGGQDGEKLPDPQLAAHQAAQAPGTVMV